MPCNCCNVVLGRNLFYCKTLSENFDPPKLPTICYFTPTSPELARKKLYNAATNSGSHQKFSGTVYDHASYVFFDLGSRVCRIHLSVYVYIHVVRSKEIYPHYGLMGPCWLCAITRVDTLDGQHITSFLHAQYYKAGRESDA